MQNVKSVSMGRMVLAAAAVLVVGGAGFALAAGPDPTYVPKSSVLTGPTSVAHTATAPYILVVTFTNGSVASFPSTMGATFSAAVGSVSSGGVYTAPASGNRDVVSGKFTANGVSTQAGRVISLF